MLLELPKHLVEIDLIARVYARMTQKYSTRVDETKRTTDDYRRLEWAAVTGRAGREATTRIFGVPMKRPTRRFAKAWLILFHVSVFVVAATDNGRGGMSLPCMVAFVSFAKASTAFSHAYSYGENGCQGHMCYPLLAALAFLSLDGGDLGRFACQTAIAASYTGSGLSKLAKAWRTGRTWSGETLAFYVINSLSTRPLDRRSLKLALRRYLTSSPSLLTLGTLATVISSAEIKISPSLDFIFLF